MQIHGNMSRQALKDESLLDPSIDLLLNSSSLVGSMRIVLLHLLADQNCDAVMVSGFVFAAERVLRKILGCEGLNFDVLMQVMR
ncbi:unnamed protein product, partial [Amoebophrya sp. A25]|eukprot:GSA25T00002811001.1